MVSIKIAQAAFWTVCGTLSAYLVSLQFIRYSENADTPKIKFKRFNESPEGTDVYPDLSFCFLGATEIPNGTAADLKQIYKIGYLKKHNLGLKEYHKSLQGKVSNISRVLEVDFNKASMGLKDVILNHEVVSNEQHGGDSMGATKYIQKTFQIPGMVCFTRQFGKHLKNNELLLRERFTLRLKNVFVHTFVHYPGQLLRTVFGNDRFDKSALTMTKDRLPLSNRYDIKLTQMTVIKRRPDAISPCDPNPSDDERFWKAIFTQIACLPSYWKNFAPVNSTMLQCKTSNELEKLNDMTSASIRKIYLAPDKKGSLRKGIFEKERILSSFATPCNEMGLVVTSQITPSKIFVKRTGTKNGEKLKTKLEDTTSDVVIKFVYQMRTYLEIRNERDYGLDSLWSNIGGFVGIFIGYSLLNLLNDGYAFIVYSFNIIKHSTSKSGN